MLLRFLDLARDFAGPAADDGDEVDLAECVGKDRHKDGRTDNRPKAQRQTARELKGQHTEYGFVQAHEAMIVQPFQFLAKF